jgi:hypothetical protein
MLFAPPGATRADLLKNNTDLRLLMMGFSVFGVSFLYMYRVGLVTYQTGNRASIVMCCFMHLYGQYGTGGSMSTFATWMPPYLHVCETRWPMNWVQQHGHLALFWVFKNPK